MAKTNQIKKVVNGEIADADDVNQIVENAGAEGGLIPYDPSTEQRDTTGSQSMGATSYPWGSLFVNREAEFQEIDPISHTVASSVSWKLLRTLLKMKDFPASYSGQGGKALRVRLDELGVEFNTPSNIQIFTSSGTFTAPAGVTKVYLTMVGGGASGGGGTAISIGGGGGGGGGSVVNRPYSVTGGNNYTVTIGAGGSAVSGNSAGNDGGDTSFDSSVVAKGGKAGQSGSSTSAGGAGGGSLNAVLGAGGVGNVSGGNGAAASSSGSVGGGGGGTPFGAGGNGADSSPAAAQSGGANTGAGGGGGYNGGGNSGAGGSGLVIVMW